MSIARRWTSQEIDRVKAEVRRELDEISPVVGDPARLARALERVRELEDDLTPPARLRSLVYVMSALVQHQRRPGLSQAQVNGLVHRAYSILQLQGIRPGVSRQAYLYGELHQVISLIHRREGEQWLAAWEQQVGAYLSRPAPPDRAGFEALASAGRNLRLGNGAMASSDYRTALGYELSEAQRQLAWIGIVRSCRLRGLYEQAHRALSEAHDRAVLTEAGKRELQWEEMCLDATASQDLTALVRAVEKGASHHQASYILEAYLWAAASQRREWLERMTKVRTLARRRDLGVRSLGPLFKAAEALERCYDKEEPLIFRLRRLGEALAHAPRIINVDKELLVWAGATRWLVRVHSFPLARHTLKQYESLSRRLSDGASNDVLGVVADLFKADWMTEGAMVEASDDQG